MAKLLRFHMLFDRELLRKLKKYSSRERLSVSCFINNILEETFYLFEKTEYTKEVVSQHDFGENGLIIRCDKKISISIKFKYMLFHFQNHFKLRSKAAVLRFILRSYFEKFEKYGEETIERIKRRTWRRWRYVKTTKQMWVKSGHMTTFNRLYSIELYTDEFMLLGIIPPYYST